MLKIILYLQVLVTIYFPIRNIYKCARDMLSYYTFDLQWQEAKIEIIDFSVMAYYLSDIRSRKYMNSVQGFDVKKFTRHKYNLYHAKIS